jgi:hypothetical protein
LTPALGVSIVTLITPSLPPLQVTAAGVAIKPVISVAAERLTKQTLHNL